MKIKIKLVIGILFIGLIFISGCEFKEELDYNLVGKYECYREIAKEYCREYNSYVSGSTSTTTFYCVSNDTRELSEKKFFTEQEKEICEK